jgi:hypothetical protein
VAVGIGGTETEAALARVRFTPVMARPDIPVKRLATTVMARLDRAMTVCGCQHMAV